MKLNEALGIGAGYPQKGRVVVINEKTGNVTASFITEGDCKTFLRAVPEYMKSKWFVVDTLQGVRLSTKGERL